MTRQEKFDWIYAAVLWGVAIVLGAFIVGVPASLLFRVLWGL